MSWVVSERREWEVWADGERLRGGFKRLEKAAEYAARLSSEWTSVDIVTVTRLVTRVRDLAQHENARSDDD